MTTNKTDTDALLKEFEGARETYEKLIEEKGKILLGALIKNIFAAHVEIKAVAWDQYTPYFNDGDACEFGVYERQFELEGRKRPLDAYDLQDVLTAEAVAKIKLADARLEALDDSVFETTFGDHASVRATLDASGEVVFEVEAAEHD